ncbi:hypothetical protein MTR_6g061730 [Medicago truncatula]|uniref:Uncharacterized protein n=1 Tax=Medicago truncatula TaxID=3880 RepID=G7KNS3_MEDTR|nr:hypothetical protein MTR_6g061730 [Medicago truncatula]
MFTPKANSKQKRVKKTQEREIGDAVKVQLARRVSLLAVVYPYLRSMNKALQNLILPTWLFSWFFSQNSVVRENCFSD